MKVRYVGPHDGVDVPRPDGSIITVQRGDDLDTSADHAATLLEQAENWEATTRPAKGKKGGE